MFLGWSESDYVIHSQNRVLISVWMGKLKRAIFFQLSEKEIGDFYVLHVETLDKSLKIFITFINVLYPKEYLFVVFGFVGWQFCDINDSFVSEGK